MTTFSSAEQAALQIYRDYKNADPSLFVTGPTGAPAPVLTDDPNVPRDILALATFSADHSLGYFADVAARTAAVTAGWLGRVCYTGPDLFHLKAGVWVQLVDLNDLPSRVPPRAGGLVLSTVSVALTTTAYPVGAWASTADTGGFYVGGTAPLRVPAGAAGMYALHVQLYVTTPSPAGGASLTLRALPTSAGINGTWTDSINNDRCDLGGVAQLAVGDTPAVTLTAIGTAWSGRTFNLYYSMYRISD